MLHNVERVDVHSAQRVLAVLAEIGVAGHVGFAWHVGDAHTKSKSRRSSGGRVASA